MRSHAAPTFPPRCRAAKRILLAAGLFYLALLPRLYVGYFNDDARFLILARSLLEGRYAALCVPGHPPESLLMPGFPLLLAPFVALFSPHWAWFKLISVVLLVMSGYLFWRLFDGWLSDEARLAALALFAFNPIVAVIAGAVMSDICLTFAVLLVFWLLRRETEGSSPAPPWLFGFIMGWAAVVRPIGVLLLPAAAAALWRRDRRRALLVLGPALAVWGAVIVRNRLVTHEVTRYGAFWSEGLQFIMSGPAALLDNLHRVSYLFFAHSLLGLRLPHAGWGIPASFVFIAFGAVLAVMGCASLWRVRSVRPMVSAMAGFVLACFLVQAVWPVLDSRYFLPLLPFALACLVEGGRILCRRLPRPGRAAAAALAVLAAAYVLQDGRLLAEAWSKDRPARLLLPRESLEWIARSAPTDAVLLTKAPVAYLYTGRQGVYAVAAASAQELRSRCLERGVTHIFSVPFDILSIPAGKTLDQGRDWDQTMTWAGAWSEGFEKVYENPREGAAVYRVVPDGS